MIEQTKTELGNHPVIIFITVIAALIAIVIFVSGKENLPEMVNGVESAMQPKLVINGESYIKPNPALTPYCVAQDVNTGMGKTTNYTVTVPEGWVMMWSSWKAEWAGGGYNDDGLIIITGPWSGALTINTGGSCSGPSEWYDFMLKNRREDYPVNSRPEFMIP